MSHTPFILGAYAAGILVLAWCALAPVVRTRRLVRALRARNSAAGGSDASDT